MLVELSVVLTLILFFSDTIPSEERYLNLLYNTLQLKVKERVKERNHI